MLAWPLPTTLRRLAPLCALLLALVLAAGAPAGAQEAPPPPQPTPVLDAGFAPLRATFNRDADKVRLLLLLDPT